MLSQNANNITFVKIIETTMSNADPGFHLTTFSFECYYLELGDYRPLWLPEELAACKA